MDSSLHFLTSSYGISAVCDDYISLSYSEDFCDSGEFTCVLSMSRDSIPGIGDPVLCGERLVYIVESVERDSVKGTVTLSGPGILSYLKRRVITSAGSSCTRCESIIAQLVDEYGREALPGSLELSYNLSGDVVNIAYEEGNLLSTVKEIAGAWGYGLSLDYYFNTGIFVFSISSIRDRCLGNTAGNAPVFLSEGFDTIEGAVFSIDSAGYVNRVTVRGAEKSDGTYYSVTADAMEFDFSDSFDDSAQPVRELFVSSGIGTGIYTTEDTDGTKTFDEAAYLDALRTRARTELSRHRPAYEINASLSVDTAKDIVVGDRCTLFSPAADVQEVCVMKKRYNIAGGRAEYSTVLRVC